MANPATRAAWALCWRKLSYWVITGINRPKNRPADLRYVYQLQDMTLSSGLYEHGNYYCYARNGEINQKVCKAFGATPVVEYKNDWSHYLMP